MKALVIILLTISVLFLAGTAKAQSDTPFAAISDHGNLLATGNDVYVGQQACDSMKADTSDATRFSDDQWECSITMGYVYGIWRMLYDGGTIHPPATGGTVTIGQDVAVVRKYFSDHPELLNQRSATLIAQAYIHAWGKPQAK